MQVQVEVTITADLCKHYENDIQMWLEILSIRSRIVPDPETDNVIKIAKEMLESNQKALSKCLFKNL